MESSVLSQEPLTMDKEVENLLAMLEEREEDVKKAAELGLHLMEVNKELEMRLERDTKEFTDQLDVRTCRSTPVFVP